MLLKFCRLYYEIDTFKMKVNNDGYLRRQLFGFNVENACIILFLLYTIISYFFNIINFLCISLGFLYGNKQKQTYK